MKLPLKLPAIKVSQHLSDFYVVSISADILLQVTYKDPLRIRELEEDGYSTIGKQRAQKIERLKEIGAYIDTTDSAFPNSIILSANFDENGVLVEDTEDQPRRWRIIKDDNGAIFLEIPCLDRIASIIDGQHRVDAFNYASYESRSMELLCAVYLDLPETYQAHLFATINFNQKPVSKSQAYELFGAGLEHESKSAWSPEKLAIYLTRKLNTKSDSPFYNHVLISAEQDDIIKDKIKGNSWAVSTATLVDGIMKLYSKNPKKDRSIMFKMPLEKGRDKGKLEDDKSPLRKLYLTNNDLALYTTINNYFSAADVELFKVANENSYIFKTVGIQALFDFLLKILEDVFQQNEKKNISIEFFSTFLKASSYVDFSDQFFQASGVGKSRIRNVLLLNCGMIKLEDLIAKRPELEADYNRVLTKK